MATTYGQWSEDEDVALRAYQSLCVTKIRRKLGRTLRDIQKRAKELGIVVQYKDLPRQQAQRVIENKIRMPEPKPAETWQRPPSKYSNSGHLQTLEKYS